MSAMPFIEYIEADRAPTRTPKGASRKVRHGVALYTKTIHGISLCAGYGGLELGITIAEPQYRTICFVEREAHAAATLVARMEDEALDDAPLWDDVKTFDGHPWSGKVHILSAGYPCQPFSFSGLRKGKKDQRHLWPDIARIIKEAKPEICFFENVEGHLDLEASEVIEELQEMGFKVKAGLFSALETGASQQRRRLFIMAYSNNSSMWMQGASRVIKQRVKVSKRPYAEWLSDWFRESCPTVDVDLSHGKIDERNPARGLQIPIYPPAPYQFGRWSEILERRPDLQPELFGLDDGMASRVERSRAAGNGVASLAAAYAWRTLKAAHVSDLSIFESYLNRL